MHVFLLIFETFLKRLLWYRQQLFRFFSYLFNRAKRFPLIGVLKKKYQEHFTSLKKVSSLEFLNEQVFLLVIEPNGL